MTPSLFDPGLEQITVAETELSRVGEDGELTVRGFPIEDLAANASYEEALFLLVHGELPTADERDRFRDDLADERTVDEAVRSVLRRAAADGHTPLSALRMGLAAADIGTDGADPLVVARRVVAVAPTLVATYWRKREGRDPVSPRSDLGHAANYHYMLTGREPSPATVRGLEAFLITTMEHGLSTSTFAARVVASTGSDPVSAATAAVGALDGPRHGGRLDRVRELLRTAHEADDASAVVRDHLEREDRLPGFGHRVYEVRDPRAAVLAATAERLDRESGEADFLDTVRTVESVGTEALAERHEGRRPIPSVDFYVAALLRGLDVPGPIHPATFGIARTGGWMAHCLEQQESGHLIRPTARYVGETDRTWTPLDERTGTDGDPLSARPSADALEPVSETLAALSEPVRLEILLVLDGADGPVSYSTLKAGTSIEDKGRFNYHLRQLRGTFVRDDESGYRLSDAGRAVVDAIVTDDRLLDSLAD